MTTKTALLGAVLLMVLAAAYAIALYPALPDRVPTHWNMRGEVDGWGTRAAGAFLVPGIMALFVAGIGVLPWLSPRNFKVDDFREVFNYVMFALLGLFACLHVVMLQAALHPQADMGRWLVGSICVFFAVLGNVLGKVRRNFWMGVRTPWTLASEPVWTATHRLAARLMVVAGISGAALVLGGAPPAWSFVLIIASLAGPVVYSLVLYKRLERAGRA